MEPNPFPGLVHEHDTAGKCKHRKMLRRLATGTVNKSGKGFRKYTRREQTR